MRQRPAVNCSSSESEYAESETNDDTRSSTDLTDVDTSSDEDDENDDDRCDSVDDEALLFVNEDHPPEYYIQQLEVFDETEYMKEDYKPSSTRLLDHMEGQWNQ